MSFAHRPDARIWWDRSGRVRSLILGCNTASAEGASRGVLLTRVRSLLPAAALNRMAWTGARPATSAVGT